MTNRSHKRRRAQAVPQTTPTYRQLVDRYLSGLTSRKEITRRVLADPPNKLSPEVLEALMDLRRIALENAWVPIDPRWGHTDK